MTTILVVDDSPIDRRLVGEFLGEDPGLDVQYVADGADALTQMERAVPDLVLTDLMMPQIDGLELVAATKSRYPQLPVILMTSQGNEEVAVQALQLGASSYVPKRSLPRKLLDTVHRVLAVSAHQRSQTRLMGCMTSSNCTFELENDCSLFGPLVTYLQEEVTRLGLGDVTQYTRIGVALEEALANALYHGNLEVDSQLREEDDRAYHALIRERGQERPYRDRRIRVTAALTRDKAVFVVVDDGSGFDPTSLPDPTDPANLERPSGRGVLLMRTFMDDVVYNVVGNSVTLVKRRDAAANSTGNGDCR